METEEENQLPFLDVLVQSKEGMQPDYIGVPKEDPRRSLPPLAVGHITIHRSRLVRCPASKEGKTGLHRRSYRGITTFVQCFPGQWKPHMVTDGVLKKRRSPKESEDDEQRVLVLPYIKGLSKKIRLACRPLSTYQDSVQVFHNPKKPTNSCQDSNTPLRTEGHGVPGPL